MTKTGVGVVGCGNISSIYLKNLGEFPGIDVVAVADLDRAKAESKAREFGIGRVCTVDELVTDAEVRIVVNLTVPNAHFSVALAAVKAGKSCYNEKPLTLSFQDGKRLVSAAEEQGVRIGCAPDTFMGAGIQTCRDLIDSGVIGSVIGFQSFMMCAGHESWHPDPAFYYQKGGGPLFDMGPYYLTAIVTLLGPVVRVTGAAKTTFPTRTITSEPKRGQVIPVETPTHLTTVLELQSGAVGQLTTSFDVVAHSLPHLEIYGSEGTLQVPDPNGFGGPIRLWKKSTGQWEEVDIVRPYAENSRGVGIIDMALAIEENRPHRACGELSCHVLEVMHAAHWTAERGAHIPLSTSSKRPEPMPMRPF